MITDLQQFELFGKSTFVKAEVKPPYRFVYEMPESACFYYLEGAKGQLYAPEQAIDTPPKDGFLLQCGRNYLANILETESTVPCVGFSVHFHADVLERVFAHDLPELLRMVNRVTPVPVRRVRRTELLDRYIDNLRFYFDNPDLVSEDLLQLKLKELILMLVRTDTAEGVRHLIGELFTSAAADFRRVIDTHLFHPISVPELAQLASMSLSTFKRTFQRHYAEPPARYLRRQKLARAAQLLANTDRRISEVCYDSGFNDLAHFSKTFLKTYGKNPSAYRAELTG